MAAPLETPAGWYGQYDSPLYGYQLEFAASAEEYIADCRAGLVRNTPMVFMVSRQGGKNETSARLQVRLLCKYSNATGSNNLIKTAPTFKPTLINSMRRLDQSLKPLPFLYERFIPRGVTKRWQQKAGTRMKPIWRKNHGYIYTLGNASVTFLSGEPDANKVGDTASIALEIDEAQAFSQQVYELEFQPMQATRNAPAIFYGTSTIKENLLEDIRERARDVQKKMGRRLLFEYDWETVCQYNPLYRKAVEEVADRLGWDHPVVLSQYCLKAIMQFGRFLGPQLLAIMRGQHPRRTAPVKGEYYVAGVDLSGAREGSRGGAKAQASPLVTNTKRDSTVVTIAKLLWREREYGEPLAVLHVVDHLYLPGVHPLSGVDRLCNYIFEHWGVLNCVVDDKGAGHQVARAMLLRYPGRCRATKGTDDNVDDLGNDLLGAINTGRLKVYRSKYGGKTFDLPDGYNQDSWEDDPEQAQMMKDFWIQMEVCEANYTASGLMKFEAPTKYIDGKPVHDDFVKSLAYTVEAAARHLYGHTKDPDPPESAPYEWGAGYD